MIRLTIPSSRQLGSLRKQVAPEEQLAVSSIKVNAEPFHLSLLSLSSTVAASFKLASSIAKGYTVLFKEAIVASFLSAFEVSPFQSDDICQLIRPPLGRSLLAIFPQDLSTPIVV